MPLSEFITSGDLKFILAFTIFTSVALYHFIKKIKLKKDDNAIIQLNYLNSKINTAITWMYILSGLSLLLGFMHSFYFIGEQGGMAPNLIFKGASYALITPVLGISGAIICKILSGTFNLKTNNPE